MGSGKSTVGELVVKKLKRTALINEDKIKWFISDFRRSKRDNAIVRGVLNVMAREYLKRGISLIIAQGFIKEKRPITPFLEMARATKSKLFVYHLNASKHVLLERIGNRAPSKNIRTPIAKSRIDRNLRMWRAHRYSIGKEFQVDKISAERISQEILKDINSYLKNS